MTIIEDMAQKEGKHVLKNDYWKEKGIAVKRYPLPVGDYILMDDKVEEVILRKEGRGIPVKKLDFMGAYSVAVDSKYGIEELCTDICGPEHERFRDECMLALANHIRLIILVENEAGLIGKTNKINPYIGDIKELHKWINPRLLIFSSGKQKYPRATKGLTLMKAAMSMTAKYGVEFVFCRPGEAGERIVELLGEKHESV